MASQAKALRSNTGAVNGSVSVTTSSTKVREGSNRQRVSITFTNDGANTVYLFKGETGAELHKGIRLNKEGGAYVCEDWFGPFCAIAETGTTVLTFSEC